MLALSMLAMLSGPVRADIVAGILGDATHLGGVQAGGADAYVDVATAITPRLQLYGIGGIGYIAVGKVDAAQSGAQGRLAGGVRWRPLTWGDREGGIDLYIEAGAGANAYWWSSHTLSRPDVNLGWGFQVRADHLLLRSGLQAMVSSDSVEPKFVCRGCTASRPQALDGGFLVVFGVSL